MMEKIEHPYGPCHDDRAPENERVPPLPVRMRLKALEISSRLNATEDDREAADFLEVGSDEIEMLSDAEMRWIERIWEIRKALGCYEKPMLSELGEEAKRAVAAAHARGIAEGLERAAQLIADDSEYLLVNAVKRIRAEAERQKEPHE